MNNPAARICAGEIIVDMIPAAKNNPVAHKNNREWPRMRFLKSLNRFLRQIQTAKASQKAKIKTSRTFSGSGPSLKRQT
jgi:ABC-type Fe3+-citrate transport system substrate-binding protein